jgi:putative tryptophan/tyrosine transport system substrate-binding protein
MILGGQSKSIFAGAVFALICALSVLPTGALAQPVQRAYRVGLMDYFPKAPTLIPLMQRLGELGYADGGNVRFEYVNKGSLDQQAAELMQKQVDLIFVAGDQHARAARRATTSIPIVMIACDAVTNGLVDSLGRPGGNLTGVSCNSAELAEKRLQILKEIVPHLSRVAVLYNRDSTGKQVDLRLTSGAGQKLGVTVLPYGIAQTADVEPSFAEMQREGAGATIVLADNLTVANRQLIADQATRYMLPLACAFSINVEAGGLFSYGPRLQDMFRMGAEYVDKLLKGAKPADLPVQEPTKYEFVINLKTAKALGLVIPQTVRLRADAVIE